jgi:ATP-dependent DNA helicase RecG
VPSNVEKKLKNPESQPMKENQQTEWKESWRDEHLKHICAFANTHGGSLLVGIKDDGTVIGISNTKKLLEDIPNKTVQLLGITVDVEVVAQNGLDILKITVMLSTIPISFRGKYYIRSGSTVQELHDHKLREFILKKDHITWDEITVPKACIDELDEKVIRHFISKAVNANRLSVEALSDNIVLTLKKLDLVKENGELTRAAILLFGNRPHKYIRTATVKIGKFGISDTDLISHNIIEGNILDMPDKIIDILRTKYLHSPISYEGLERKEQLEYPEKAIREAILNAVVHRDYGEHTDITIHIYDDKIVIWNSGTLIAPLNVEMLRQKHPSKRRNALIANIFFRIGYIEAWGRGILLMTEEMKNAGLPEPLIVEYAGRIQLTLFKNNNKNEISRIEKSKEKSKEKIIKIISENPYISMNELSVLTGLSMSGIEKNIRNLKRERLLRRIGPAKGGYWQVIEK